MASKKVNLKPIGQAIEKAQAELKALAKHAPREKSLELKTKVEALAIVHLQIKVRMVVVVSRRKVTNHQHTE